MEGLETIELNSKDVYGSLYGRFDAEFFSKKYIQNEESLDLKKSVFLSELAVITDGEHGSPDLDDESGIVYLSGNNIKDNQIDFQNVRYCTKKLHIKNARSSVKKDTVLMSIVGSVGKTSVVHDDVTANTDRNVATIKPNILINPHYLSIFLNCDFGTRQTNRFSTGNVQPLLNLSQIKQIKICNFSMNFQSEVAKFSQAQDKKQKHSRGSYALAESLLFKTLGMSDFAPSNESVNIKSFKDSFACSGRLDAEHYQPKYDQLLESFDATGYEIVNIDAIVFEMLNGAEVREYQDDGVPYLRIGDLKYLDIDPDSVVCIDPQSAEKGLNKIELLTGDVLLSRSGSLAVSAVVDSNWTHALISSHLIRLRIRDTRFDPYFFALFLSTTPGKMQIQQWSNGGVQPEINQPALKGIYVPVVPKNTQLQIRKLILKAKELRNESKRLLEVAKRAVEVAIEQDEAAGMAYLKANGSVS